VAFRLLYLVFVRLAGWFELVLPTPIAPQLAVCGVCGE
jgi:hypothetical protein